LINRLINESNLIGFSNFLIIYIIKYFRGNYIFPHELLACVILPPRTATSTKKEHQTTIFTYFTPFRQSNSCKDLNALTQFKKLPKYPHLKKKKKKKTEGK